jgi:eukaryotic-like serine/threonine-protein kinase
MARVAPAIKRLLAQPDAERRIGPFLLLSQLGRGGFAPVWLAKEVYGEAELRTAAVKLFSLEGAGGTVAPTSLGPPSQPPAPLSPSAEGLQRIFAEARALCRVEHPHVVRFYALPIDETSGVLGLAMEHVAGTPLHERIAERGRLAVPETLAVGTAIAWALAAVHGASLVHRDVKPGNVIESAGVYKLIDFGIAAAEAPDSREGMPPPEATMAEPRPVHLPDLPLDAVGSKLSSLGELCSASAADGSRITVPLAIPCGTIGYIDPASIAHGAMASPASDLYALGAMLFECLTGHVPAAALPCGASSDKAPQGARGLRGEVLDGRVRPPPLLDLEPLVPPSLARLIDALLAPERGARPASAERVARSLEQIRDELSGLGRALPPESIGPFRGLARFKEGDRGVYFGRGSEIAAALETLRSRGVVTLVGPSGSGKSSLARAGVLPAIAEGALGGWPSRWDTASLSPGADPRAAALEALAGFLPAAGEADARTPEGLVLALAERAQTTGRGLVVLVDQLEELATLAEPEGQAWMVDLLARLGEQAIPGVRVVAAARRDLLDPLLGLGPLGKALMRGSVLIEPISGVTWGDVLDQALAAYGYSFEDRALRDELLAELESTASAMPLVQFALTELWHKRDPVAKKVTRKGLREIGGLAGALGRHADATLAELTRDHAGAEDAARAVLLALTTPQGTRATRSLPELLRVAGPGGAEAVAAFERARLIISGGSRGSRESPGPSEVTLAHEALLTQWHRLRTWVAEAREDRLLAEELERDAARWRADPEVVPRWQKHRLAFGEELNRRRSVHLSEDAIAFLKTSRRATRRLQWMGAAAAAAVFLSLAAGAGAYIRAIAAQEAATMNVLRKEKASREVAEQQKRELQEKQARIDQLVRALGGAPTEDEVLNLKRQVFEMQGVQAAQSAQASAPPRERPRGVSAAPGRAPAEPQLASPSDPKAKAASVALEPSQQW